jgi:Sec-independent protein translocase protein TatA
MTAIKDLSKIVEEFKKALYKFETDIEKFQTDVENIEKRTKQLEVTTLYLIEVLKTNDMFKMANEKRKDQNQLTDLN